MRGLRVGPGDVVSAPRQLVRLYIAQSGQTASTVVTREDGDALLRSIVGQAPFLLSTKERAPNGDIARMSVFVAVPAVGGLVAQLTEAVAVPLDARGAPIPFGPDGIPLAKPAAWDDPAKAPLSVFERLPWPNPAAAPAASETAKEGAA